MKYIIRVTRPVLLAICLLVAKQTLAQKQGDFWFFGERCGLNFISGAPVFAGGGNTQSTKAFTQEGCSSICDSGGNLLFYTNGVTIWNRFDSVMENGSGLLGNIASTQSSLIVPQPDCSNYYYVFTTDAFNSLVNGFRYSLVDICDGRGLGEVVYGEKNVLLLDTVAEKLCGMMDNDGNYWILVHKLFSNAFCAYHLTSGGVGDTVVSRIGSYEGDIAKFYNDSAAIGQMKFSPDGSKVALVVGNHAPCVVELYNFNQATGKLSSYVTLPVTLATGNGYGIEFSPNSSKIYATNGDTMVQFNLMAGGGVNDSIIASRTVLSDTAQKYTWGLQLGADNKIYVCQGDSTLGVINQPNLAGTASDFLAHGVSLHGHLNRLTLPGFLAGYRYGNLAPNCNFISVNHQVINAACAGASGSAVELASGGTAPVTITWNTNPVQYGANADNLEPGTYVATVTGANPCSGPLIIHDSVTIQKGTGILAMPNAFTPNGDGINDIYLPHIECSDNLQYVLRIYNRWGQLLFETHDPSQGWDGKFHGKPELLDVYDYYVEFHCGNCNEYKKGNIMLLR